MRTIYKPLFRSLLTDFENSIVAIVVFQSCILIKKKMITASKQSAIMICIKTY